MQQLFPIYDSIESSWKIGCPGDSKMIIDPRSINNSFLGYQGFSDMSLVKNSFGRHSKKSRSKLSFGKAPLCEVCNEQACQHFNEMFEDEHGNIVFEQLFYCKKHRREPIFEGEYIITDTCKNSFGKSKFKAPSKKSNKK